MLILIYLKTMIKILVKKLFQLLASPYWRKSTVNKDKEEIRLYIYMDSCYSGAWIENYKNIAKSCDGKVMFICSCGAN